MKFLFELAAMNYRKSKKEYFGVKLSVGMSVILILLSIAMYRTLTFLVGEEANRKVENRTITVISQKGNFDEDSLRDGLPIVNSLNQVMAMIPVEYEGMSYRKISKKYDDILFEGESFYHIGNENVNWLQSDYRESTNDENVLSICYGRDIKIDDDDVVICPLRASMKITYGHPEKMLGKNIIVKNGENVFSLEIVGIYDDIPEDQYEIKEPDASVEPDELNYSEIKRSLFPGMLYLSGRAIDDINGCDSFDTCSIIFYNILDTKRVSEIFAEKISNSFFCEYDYLLEATDYLAFFSIVFILLGIVLAIVSLVNLATTIDMLIYQRQKTIGIQRILGFSYSNMLRMYSMELFLVLIEILLESMGIVALVCLVMNNVFADIGVLSEFGTFVFCPDVISTILIVCAVVIYVFGVSIVVLKKRIVKSGLIQIIREG